MGLANELKLLTGVVMASTALAADALSPEAAALIAPVPAAYASVEATQAKWPPATTAKEKLERMYDLDQAGRAAMGAVDLSSLPKPEQLKAANAMNREVERHDLANQQTLKQLIPPEGWFKVSTEGDKGSLSAFLIVQHASNDPQLMRDTLPKLKSALDEGEASGQWYAMMFDRVAVEFDHKPQRYGTQLRCVQGAWKLDKTEEPAKLDARRKEIGLKETEAQYLKHFSATC
jgi:hypothetical protein